MERHYPVSLTEIDAWRRKHGVTSDEARKRFIQFAILESIATIPALAAALSFKGGNALRFVYGNKRTTLDLDFTATSSFPDNADEIRALLNSAFATAVNSLGVKMKCQSVRRNPKHHGTHPTFSVKAGYQLPGDPYFADFGTSARTVSSVAEIEISLNDVVCEAQRGTGAPGHVRVAVCVLEDIIAEKLRALLQQPIRNRHRKQDVYDIARMIQLHGASLDRDKIGRYLLQKGAARDVPVSRAAFNADVRQRAAYEYDTLFSSNDPDFIPFDIAWDMVKCLVNEIPIPP